MEKSKVFFTDFRCHPGTNNLQKLQKLCKKAGIGNINFEGKFLPSNSISGNWAVWPRCVRSMSKPLPTSLKNWAAAPS